MGAYDCLCWEIITLSLQPSTESVPAGNSYPVEMCKALDLTWLFAGLRNNEIVRLRLGSIRWQKEEVHIPGPAKKLPASSVCMLDVPVNKTSTDLTKPR